MNNRDNKNNNNAIVQSAVFISPPSVAFPICAAISVVKLLLWRIIPLEELLSVQLPLQPQVPHRMLSQVRE